MNDEVIKEKDRGLKKVNEKMSSISRVIKGLVGIKGGINKMEELVRSLKIEFDTIIDGSDSVGQDSIGGLIPVHEKFPEVLISNADFLLIQNALVQSGGRDERVSPTGTVLLDTVLKGYDWKRHSWESLSGCSANGPRIKAIITILSKKFEESFNLSKFRLKLRSKKSYTK